MTHPQRLSLKPSPRRDFLRVEQAATASVERKREEFEPLERKRGCGVCHCCKTNNRFGCSANTDQSQIDAVMAMAE